MLKFWLIFWSVYYLKAPCPKSEMCQIWVDFCKNVLKKFRPPEKIEKSRVCMSFCCWDANLCFFSSTIFCIFFRSMKFGLLYYRGTPKSAPRYKIVFFTGSIWSVYIYIWYPGSVGSWVRSWDPKDLKIHRYSIYTSITDTVYVCIP